MNSCSGPVINGFSYSCPKYILILCNEADLPCKIIFLAKGHTEFLGSLYRNQVEKQRANFHFSLDLKKSSLQLSVVVNLNSFLLES